ncbi:MAG: DegT/DnrJ/EryC1/StrS aminotransferase family protein [Acidobacteria bacterium]|nr:DegT/DnrJ/EryC1/StrS aminotransferase family protein [Acidobacteriota bacterium]
MATYALTGSSSSLNPLVRREYLVWREPDMAEADLLAEPATGVVRSFGLEQRTETFERAFEQRVGASFAITMASREAALRVALKALGLGAGDDVVVPAITSMTTANAVLQVGANPVLADVDPATHLLTADTVDRARTKQTRAIVVTHLCGRAANLQALEPYAHDAGLALVNDARLGVEIQHGGQNIAQYGALSVYGADPARRGSTHEGGIITTNNAVLAKRLAQLRRGQQPEQASHDGKTGLGCEFHMTAAQASLGLRYLDCTDPLNRRRRMIWNRYDEALAGLPLLRPAPVTPGDRHALGIYTVLVGTEAIAGGRDAVALALHKARIGTGVHYRGVHLHPHYRDGLGYAPTDFPTATRISNQTLSLPLSAAMRDGDVEDVIIALTDILESGRR